MGVFPLLRMSVAERLRQPVTWLVTGVSVAFLGLGFLFGQFNFEDQDRLRMFATTGVAVVVLNAVFLTVVGASQTVHDELASRTALTLFSKPLSRGGFLIGKTLAVWVSTSVSCLVVMAVHAGVLGWVLGHGFDLDHHGHHHGGEGDELWLSWPTVIAAYGLALMQAALFASISTVLALRMPFVANVLVSFGIFVVGHVIVAAGAMGCGPLPALALFQVDDAIQFRDHRLSPGYVALTGLYTALACAGWLISGLALFRRQDIA